ncbi:LOW QUALITY PROTEIN: protein peste [Drosophila albomicans]|uniref:LOW QUALITY PROTEIN: protein peste n=1 Tax=Drosophila albomicans TaxID=7291 RepID=A0A6P8WCX0_DROAB|nr:LOW QUALITY PROTEIN: protein peste [Drosophila albomicans]
MSTGCGSDEPNKINNSRIIAQAASTTPTTSSRATLYKRLASVQRCKSKRTGDNDADVAQQKSTKVSCKTKRLIAAAANTTEGEDSSSDSHSDSSSSRSRHHREQEQQQQLKMTSRACHCAWRLVIVILGVCFIAAGVYLLRNWIDIFTRMRGKEMALSPTSRAYPDWKVSPLPLNFDVYLFNWTNPEDFYVDSPRKPRFEQLGPYRFREQPDKVDIEWHNQNASVSFRKKAFYYFDAAGSNGTLKDIVTSVNTVAHAAARRLDELSSFAKFVASATLSGIQEVSETHTAEEWLFKGFIHPLVSLGKFIRPEDVPYDRVGYQYDRNGTTSFDGDINMFTGADDISKMGQIYTWNNLTHTGAFEGTCGEVHGSMGEFFPPNLSTNGSVYLYMPKMCRAVPLDYTETVTVHGVTAYKFSGTRHAVDNGTMYPDASCYCVKGKCNPAGVINIAPCSYNASIYMSYPHFYMADPSYLEAVDGLQPEKEKHEFYMALEPNAGVPMDVGGGFQANFLMEPIRGVSLYARVPRVMMPLMWAEERVRVTEEIAANIALVPLIVLIGQIVTGILLAGGLLCTCWYPTRKMTRLCHSDDPKAKAAVLRPLTTLSVAGGIGSGLTNANANAITMQQLFHQHDSQNERVGVRLLDYRRSSGLTDSGCSSASERLLESGSTDVIIS